MNSKFCKLLGMAEDLCLWHGPITSSLVCVCARLMWSCRPRSHFWLAAGAHRSLDASCVGLERIAPLRGGKRATVALHIAVALALLDCCIGVGAALMLYWR